MDEQTSLECPNFLTNSLRTSMDGVQYEYTGVIYQPHFDEDLNLVCCASIAKKKIEIIPAHTEFRLFRLGRVDVPESTRETMIWRCESEGNSYYAIHSDGNMAGYSEGSYRWFLLDALNMYQHHVTPKLFSLIFDALDQQLLEFYRSARPDLPRPASVRAVS